MAIRRSALRRRLDRRIKPPSAKQLQRQRWVVDHPVRASLLLGVAWGVLMALLAGRTLVWTVVWIVAGLGGFGPVTVGLTLRHRRKHPFAADD